MPVAGQALPRCALDDLRKTDDGDEILGRDLATVDLLEKVDRVLDAAELRVVVLDVAGRELAHPLYLDVVDHGREDLLARLMAVADRDPDKLPPAVLHALVAQPDRRGLAPALELVYEDRGVEVQDVQGQGRIERHASGAAGGLSIGGRLA